MSVKVIAQLNAFSTEKTEYEFEPQPVSAIIKKIDTNNVSNTGWRVLFNDEIITDFSRVPTDGTTVLLKLVPTGDNKETGNGMKIGGGALAALGVIVGLTIGWTGFGGVLAGSLIGSGVGLLLGGVALYNMDIPSLKDRPSPDQDPSIRGSQNQLRQRGYIPVLLGKRRFYTDLAMTSYTWVDPETGSMYLYQLFCAGQKDIVIDESTLKIDETLLSSYQSGDNIEYAISYGGSVPPFFKKCVHEDQIMGILRHSTEDGTDASIIKTTPECTELNVDIFFLSGLGKYNDEGKLKETSVTVKAYYKKADEPDASYQLLGSFTETGNVITGEELKTKRYAITKTGLVSSMYTVKITRETVDSTDNKVIDDVYVGSIRAIKDELPVSARRCRQLTLLALKIKATEKLNNVVQKLNFIAQSKMPVWDGIHSGSSGWTQSELTSNPASAAVYAMQTEIAQQRLASSEIDWTSFERLYTWCNVHGYECNTYITDSMSISQLLSAIGSTCRTEILRMNGKITALMDIERSSAVQLFTPRNSYNYSETIISADIPDALNIGFEDKDSGYAANEFYVYNTPSGNKAEEPHTIQDVQLWGVTSSEQARKLGMWKYAVTRSRPFFHTWSCDVEYLMCQKGDWVKYAGDIALIGTTQCRVAESLYRDGQCIGIIVDELVHMSEGINVIRYRQSDGTLHLQEIIYSAEDTKTLLFVSVLPGEEAPSPDDLVTVGLQNFDTIDLIIADIKCDGNLSAEITAVDYSPAVFDVDNPDFVLPDFDNKISSVPATVDNGIISPSEWNIFLTYHDGLEEPDTPEGDGTTNGWHITPSSESIWVSSKYAKNIISGQWSKPRTNIGPKGEDGTDGKDGKDGKDGISLTNKGNWTARTSYDVNDYVYYASNKTSYVCKEKHTSGSTFDSSKWTVLSAQGQPGSSATQYYIHYVYADDTTGTNYSTNQTRKYIGTYTDTTQADAASFEKLPQGVVWSQITGTDGKDGEDGKDGTNGSDGNGISAINYYYAVTTTNSAPSADSVTSTTIPTTFNETNRFLWQKEVITYTKVETPKTTVALIGVYGETGSPTKDNLLKNSNFKDGVISGGWEKWSSPTSLEKASDTLFGQCAKCVFSATQWQGSQYFIDNVKAGATYTLSCYFWNNSGATLTIGVHNRNSSKGIISQVWLPSFTDGGATWVRKEITFTTPANTTNLLIMIGGNVASINNGKTAYWTNVKLEENTVATSWILHSTEMKGDKGDSGTSYVTLVTDDDLNTKLAKDTIYVSTVTAVCASLKNKPADMVAGEVRVEVKWCGGDAYIMQYLYARLQTTYQQFSRAVYNKTTFSAWTPMGENGEDGYTPIKGVDYDDGNGISSIEYTYAVTSTSAAPAASSVTSTIIPTTFNATNRYLWQKEVISYTKTSTPKTTVALIGVYGEKGNPGEPGSPGAPGTSAIATTISANTVYVKCDSAGNVLNAQTYTINVNSRQGTSRVAQTITKPSNPTGVTITATNPTANADGSIVFAFTNGSNLGNVSKNALTFTVGTATFVINIIKDGIAHGLGMKVNYSTFTTSNNAEIYFHGYDENGQPADVNGWVMFKGEKVEIAKGMHVNPDTFIPWSADVFMVKRSTTIFNVWYDSTNTAWKYLASGGSSTANWSWQDTDIIFARYKNSSASEGAIPSGVIYNPALTKSEIFIQAFQIEANSIKAEKIDVDSLNVSKLSSPSFAYGIGFAMNGTTSAITVNNQTVPANTEIHYGNAIYMSDYIKTATNVYCTSLGYKSGTFGLYQGTYSSSVNYKKSDIVIFNSSYFICKVDCKNVTPSNSSYWWFIGSDLNSNTSLGNSSLSNVLGGSFNTAIGFEALKVCSEGSNNTALGAYALNKLTTGNANSAIGIGSMISLTTGIANVGLGDFSLQKLTTGNYNVAIGKSSGTNLTTGRYNISIGCDATFPSDTLNRQFNIGNRLYYLEFSKNAKRGDVYYTLKSLLANYTTTSGSQKGYSGCIGFYGRYALVGIGWYSSTTTTMRFYTYNEVSKLDITKAQADTNNTTIGEDLAILFVRNNETIAN